MSDRKSVTILLAEDDPDDRMLVQDAVAEGHGPDRSNASAAGKVLISLALETFDPRAAARAPLRTARHEPAQHEALS